MQLAEITLGILMVALVIGWLLVMVCATLQIRRRKEQNATG